MTTTTVSVLITSYNRAATLRRAIDSVLAQDYPAQIIVVDDGSTDGSVRLLREYYDRGKISVLHCMEHYGLMVAYREGLRRCTGDYIAVCDCDDYWIAKDKLTRQVAYMEAHPDCPLCTTQVWVEQGGWWLMSEPPGEWSDDMVTYDSLMRGNAYIHAQSYLMRRSALDRWVDFDRMARRFHVWDYPIVLELIQHGRFHRIPEFTAVYVKNTESFTNTRSQIRRLKYILGNYKIRLYYIARYGCRWNTAGWLVYRMARDIMSVLLRRWNG